MALTGEAMPRRLLGMQPAGWASPQLHPYAHDTVMEDPEHHAWTMLRSTAQGNIYSRLAAPRRFFSDSPEHAQEVSGRLTSYIMQLWIVKNVPGTCMSDKPIFRVLAASSGTCLRCTIVGQLRPPVRFAVMPHLYMNLCMQEALSAVRMPCTASLMPAASVPGSEPHARADHQPLKMPGHTLLLSKVGTVCALIWKSSYRVQEGECLHFLTFRAAPFSFLSTLLTAEQACPGCCAQNLEVTELSLLCSGRWRVCSGNEAEPEPAQSALCSPSWSTLCTGSPLSHPAMEIIAGESLLKADVTLCLDTFTQEGSRCKKTGITPCNGY